MILIPAGELPFDLINFSPFLMVLMIFKLLFYVYFLKHWKIGKLAPLCFLNLLSKEFLCSCMSKLCASQFYNKRHIINLSLKHHGRQR